MKSILNVAVVLAALSTANADTIKRHSYERSTIPIARAVEVPPGYITLYHSGLGPRPADPQAKKGSPEYWGNTKAQAQSVFEQMDESLRSLGWGLQDIVKMTVFLVGDPALGGQMDFAGFMEAYREHFGAARQHNLPARSTVQVAALAVPGMFVEIEIVLSRVPK